MRRPIPLTVALTCALLFCTACLISGCGPSPNVNTNGALVGTPTPAPATVNCNDSPTNQELVNGVYAMLAYKNPEYAKQFWQFNVTADAVNKLVMITGWSGMRGQIIMDAQTALKNCTLKYDNFVADRSALNPQWRVGCPPNYAPCGDICVPAGEPCKVTSELQSAPGNAPVCNPGPPIPAATAKPPKAK